MRKILIIPLLGLLTSFNFNKPPLKTSASQFNHLPAELMPTNINGTIASDADLINFYESTIQGKSGNTLLAALNTLISGHREYNYESSTHRFIYKIIDRNWDIDPLQPAALSNFDYSGDNGFIKKLYADYNDDIETADRFKNEGKTRVSFDKEHIWAQSLGDFGRAGGAGSDFHALWPSDVKGNQQAHSNYNFGEPTSKITEYKNDYGTYVGRNGYIAGSTQKVFEPLDEYKGDIARAMFYMPARYFTQVPGNKLFPKLTLVDYSPAAVVANETTPGLAGVLSTLLEWNELDPVDEHEIRRNNLIANNYQGNRNPFIDYPQLARIAYDPNYSGSGVDLIPETSSVGTASDPFSDLTLESISLNTTNAKTDYFLEDGFDSRGIIVRGTYNDGSSRIIKNFTTSLIQGASLNSAGEFDVTITVEHNGVILTMPYSINVSNMSLKQSLFITQIYGGGGNDGAIYEQDFVELYNASPITIRLNGKSLQYSGPTGDSWTKANTVDLVGQIEPGTHHLVGMRTTVHSSETHKVLPMVENFKNINMGGANIKLALVNSTQGLSGTDPSGESQVIDFVGAGSANGYLGSKAPAITSSALALKRKEVGGVYQNNRNNGSDFVLGTPTPRNSALSIAYSIMEHPDVNNGDCLFLFDDYKDRVMNLTKDFYDEEDENNVTRGQLYYFQTNTLEAKMIAGRERYEAWSFFNNKLAYEWPEEAELNETIINNNATQMSVIIVLLSLLSLGLYSLVSFKKRVTIS